MALNDAEQRELLTLMRDSRREIGYIFDQLCGPGDCVGDGALPRLVPPLESAAIAQKLGVPGTYDTKAK